MDTKKELYDLKPFESVQVHNGMIFAVSEQTVAFNSSNSLQTHQNPL